MENSLTVVAKKMLDQLQVKLQHSFVSPDELLIFKNSIKIEDNPEQYEHEAKDIIDSLGKVSGQPLEMELVELLHQSNHPLTVAAAEHITELQVKIKRLQRLIDTQKDDYERDVKKVQEEMKKEIDRLSDLINCQKVNISKLEKQIRDGSFRANLGYRK